YDDSDPTLDTGTTYFSMPLRVVSTVSAEDARGIGALASTKYSYASLRGSAYGRGPQGFKTIQIDEPEPSGVTTVTTYGQGYPYTGLPQTVVRSRRTGPGSSVELSKTDTTYCDIPNGVRCSPPRGSGARWIPTTSLFVFPNIVTTKTDVLDGS